MLYSRHVLSCLFLTTAFAACNGATTTPEDKNSASLGSTSAPKENSPLPDTSQKDPTNPAPAKPSYSKQALLFNGTGVSISDWQTTESILKANGFTYQLANSAQLSAMTLDEISDFGVVIVPGGSGGTIAGNVDPATRILLRQAVRERGVGYVGFCAGAWVAVGPEAETLKTASYGFALSKGSVLTLFEPNGQTPTAAMVPVSFPDGTSRQLVWWGGPATPEWKNGVVARYDDGEPAISQIFSGSGLVVISGPHPEAPQGWRATAGYDSDGLDQDIALDMINAALKKEPLPVF
jgi:glutamine amidotransferase-like uncharacterized protein